MPFRQCSKPNKYVVEGLFTKQYAHFQTIQNGLAAVGATRMLPVVP